MNDDSFYYLIWALGLIALYGALVRGLFVLARPLRTRMVELGAEIARSTDASDEIRAEVETEIATNFSSFWAWVTAALVFPAFARALWRIATGTQSRGPWRNDAMDEFRYLALITSLCNSPLALGLFCVQFALASVFVKSATNVAELLSLVDTFPRAASRRPVH